MERAHVRVEKDKKALKATLDRVSVPFECKISPFIICIFIITMYSSNTTSRSLYLIVTVYCVLINFLLCYIYASYVNKMEHKYSTRGNLLTLRLPSVRTKAAKKSFIFQGPACYNEVPADIRNLNSLTIFKHQLKENLLNL